MTEDVLLNTPLTALVMLGTDTAIATATKANMIAYSTIVTPFIFFFCICSPCSAALSRRFDPLWQAVAPSLQKSDQRRTKAKPERTQRLLNACMRTRVARKYIYDKYRFEFLRYIRKNFSRGSVVPDMSNHRVLASAAIRKRNHSKDPMKRKLAGF